MSALQTPPLSLYVHLPWCVRKCPYCDFNSHAIDGHVPEERYARALLEDLETQTAQVRGRTVRSIFFGGGTPSLFSGGAIGGILAGIRSALPVTADAEITLEANPGTVERGRFDEYRSAGVNRVSLGGQSFHPGHLARLGRIHSVEDTRAAAAELHAAGLANFNIDLMYGLPGQSVPESIADVKSAIELAPAHISHYQLTLEPGTVFFHRPPQLPDEDSSWEMQLLCQEALATADFLQYEVSAYARPGRGCVHNLNYWQFGDYLGIGAGAHGKLTDPRHGVFRTVRLRQPRQYLDAMEQAARPPEVQMVCREDLPFEFMLNTLRLVEGFAVIEFERRTGLELDCLQPAISETCQRGLLERNRMGGWRATSTGMRFLNDLIGTFLPAVPAVSAIRTATQPANPL